MLCRLRNSLVKDFEPSSRAAAREGPKQRSSTRRLEILQVELRCFESVDDARNQGHLRTDDGQVDALPGGKFQQRLNVIRRDVDVADIRFERGAGVAGSHVHMLHARRLRAFPCQCVLAAAAADDQDFHKDFSGGNGASR